ncbi:unnamed protein product [Moneuplotes crassus]|uniref:JAB1/MPN/MOV34 metalloenzyme domain-containing protein n=1 Tax=Euplotes crassus TaxID=5936 RepID=A0AAD1X704_EUPCR|nr:unnamed protein product [Moneuplotes crassus]
MNEKLSKRSLKKQKGKYHKKAIKKPSRKPLEKSIGKSPEKSPEKCQEQCKRKKNEGETLESTLESSRLSENNNDSSKDNRTLTNEKPKKEIKKKKKTKKATKSAHQNSPKKMKKAITRRKLKSVIKPICEEKKEPSCKLAKSPRKKPLNPDEILIDGQMLKTFSTSLNTQTCMKTSQITLKPLSDIPFNSPIKTRNRTRGLHKLPQIPPIPPFQPRPELKIPKLQPIKSPVKSNRLKSSPFKKRDRKSAFKQSELPKAPVEVNPVKFKCPKLKEKPEPKISRGERPKRKTKKPIFFTFDKNGRPGEATYGENEIPLESDYMMILPSKHKKGQPLEIYLSLECLLIMTIHSHLYSTEVIGYLGGHTLDLYTSLKPGQEQKSIIFFHHCYPCNPLEPTEDMRDKIDRTRNVEMETNSSLKQKLKVEENGEKVLSWYHSHPFFEVSPSQIDIKNHSSHQKMFSNDKKPFVGLIIGPYLKRISDDGVKSLLKCFHTVGETPFELKINHIPDCTISKDCVDLITKLISKSMGKPDKTNLDKIWVENPKKGEKLKRGEKLIKEIKQMLLDNIKNYKNFRITKPFEAKFAIDPEFRETFEKKYAKYKDIYKIVSKITQGNLSEQSVKEKIKIIERDLSVSYCYDISTNEKIDNFISILKKTLAAS